MTNENVRKFLTDSAAGAARPELCSVHEVHTEVNTEPPTTEGTSMADKRVVKSGAADRGLKSRNPMEDPMTHTNFSCNLDACVVQASRYDRDSTPAGPAVVEHVWIMSRPPKLGRGVEPTVSARRTYVMLTHIQGQTIDTGDVVCKRVCTTGGADKEKEASNKNAAKNKV